MDSEGYITITGRIKDLIIRGGENIHPLEVENCLFANDAVKEVSVVGIPDEKYGEVVAAFVVPVKGKDIGIKEVRGWVRERLSHHLGVLDFSNFLAGTVVQNIRFSESLSHICAALLSVTITFLTIICRVLFCDHQSVSSTYTAAVLCTSRIQIPKPTHTYL
jgi:hypothetical protein